jgi:hypothetical protein
MAAQDAELTGRCLQHEQLATPAWDPSNAGMTLCHAGRPALTHLVNDPGLSAAVIGVHGARVAGSLGAHAQQWAICLRVAGTERRLRME